MGVMGSKFKGKGSANFGLLACFTNTEAYYMILRCPMIFDKIWAEFVKAVFLPLQAVLP